MAVWWKYWKRRYWLYGGIANLVFAIVGFLSWRLIPTRPTEEVVFATTWLVLGLVFLYRYRHQDEPEHLDLGIHNNEKT